MKVQKEPLLQMQVDKADHKFIQNISIAHKSIDVL